MLTNLEARCIELHSLPSVNLFEFYLLPPSPGIYFAVDTSLTVYYIGKAVNLYKRWMNGHHRGLEIAAIPSIKIFYLLTDKSDMSAVEKQAICQFKPIFNSQNNSTNGIKRSKPFSQTEYRSIAKGGKRKVAISLVKNRIRLTWTYKKRYFLNLKLSDSPLNRDLSRSVALQIEKDICCQSFDDSLEKYKRIVAPININFEYIERLEAMTKAKKGTVAIQSVQGRLRLCWSYQGKRHYLTLGLPDSKINRSAAGLVASRIEEDIRTQNFDESLAKYRTIPERSIALLTLFDRYWNDKRSSLQTQTNQKYSALRNQLCEFFGQANVAIDSGKAQSFINHLLTLQKPTTTRDRLSILKACWNWGIQYKLASENPWVGVSIAKSTPSKPRPFNKGEVEKILEFFKSNIKYQYYLDFVEFRLRTGCRTGEAAGLCWKHLSNDCGEIDITESITKGDRKPTKTGEARSFQLSDVLKTLLLDRRPENASPDDLVFPSPKGKAINGENFAKRYWKPALTALGIPYRRPYNTRSTFASHALEVMSPAEVCDITGHSQETLFRNYAGSIRRSTLPDLW